MALDLEAIEGTLTKRAQDLEQNRNEVENVTKALENAKANHLSALEELESLMARFDEAKKEAEKAGRDAATQDVKASMAKETEEQVSQLEAEIATLVEASSTLQTKLDEAEMALATASWMMKRVKRSESS